MYQSLGVILTNQPYFLCEIRTNAKNKTIIFNGQGNPLPLITFLSLKPKCHILDSIYVNPAPNSQPIRSFTSWGNRAFAIKWSYNEIPMCCLSETHNTFLAAMLSQLKKGKKWITCFHLLGLEEVVIFWSNLSVMLRYAHYFWENAAGVIDRPLMLNVYWNQMRNKEIESLSLQVCLVSSLFYHFGVVWCLQFELAHCSYWLGFRGWQIWLCNSSRVCFFL